MSSPLHPDIDEDAASRTAHPAPSHSPRSLGEDGLPTAPDTDDPQEKAGEPPERTRPSTPDR